MHTRRLRKRAALAVLLLLLFCAACLVFRLPTSSHARRALLEPVGSAGNSGQHFLGSDCRLHSHHPLFQAWKIAEGVEEAAAAANQSVGPFTCPVCGGAGLTIQHWNGSLREEGRCPACKASNRLRQLALGATLVAAPPLDRSVSSLAELAARQQLLPLRIYNTQCRGPLARQLQQLGRDRYTCSEYMGPKYRAGQVVKGMRHEDLQGTSFEGGSFDVVLSTEVFEHIPDPYRAHQEVLRILVPGGAHVFTIPFIANEYKDQIKARLVPNGSVVFTGAPEFHKDPIRKEGIPVFTIFAQEMVDRLCSMGFLVRVLHLRVPEAGILGASNYVFVAAKPL